MYCDMELTKGMEGNREEEVEDKFRSIMNIFQCITSRDQFLKTYTKFFA